MVDDETTKVEWIGAFMNAALWKENQIAQAGLVPKITVQHPIPELNVSDTHMGQKCFLLASSLTDVASDTTNPNSPVMTTNSSRSSSLNMDTIFPFTSPDISTAVSNQSSRKSNLQSQEALVMIYASNARFFKNGGFKIDGTAAGGSPPKHAAGGTGCSSTTGPTAPLKCGVRRKTDTDIQVQTVQAPVVKKSTCDAVIAQPVTQPISAKTLSRRQTSPIISHQDRMNGDKKAIQILNVDVATNVASQKRQSMDLVTSPKEAPRGPAFFSMEI
ncbi:hypothetical protein BC830DRAFT_778341 [Chytriomyces sp. MP71]|nr:hypothetical protein BC830DRAFT_778341 [Chytriomyces sp. MP71]